MPSSDQTDHLHRGLADGALKLAAESTTSRCTRRSER